MANGTNPALDLRVRHAMSLALNREGAVPRVLLGYGRVATQDGVPGMVGYLDGARPDAYAPNEARCLLAEAGYAARWERPQPVDQPP